MIRIISARVSVSGIAGSFILTKEVIVAVGTVESTRKVPVMVSAGLSVASPGLATALISTPSIRPSFRRIHMHR